MFTPVAPEPTSSDSAQEAQHCVDSLPQGSAVSAWMNDCDSLVPHYVVEDSVGCRLVETKPDSSTMSPASRMAIAIRARKERASSRQLSTAGAVSLDVVQPNSMGHGQQSERDARLSADELKILYARGHRSFTMRDLSAAELPKQTLSGSNFAQSKLPQANCRHADLSKCVFSRADLAHASLQGANLQGAYFNNADLQGADLRGANLKQASLTNANLRGVNR